MNAGSQPYLVDEEDFRAGTFQAYEAADPLYRQLPSNLEVEMALLGAILVDNRVLERVSDFLEAEHFFDPSHRSIFEAIRISTERGGQASPATLRDHFEQQGRLDDVGGPRYLAELAATAIGVVDAAAYGRIIRDQYLRRALISIGEEVVNEAYDSDLELTAAGRVEKAEHRLFELATTGGERAGFRPFARTLAAAIDMAESAFRREGQLTGITTGFIDLDAMLGGLQRSDLVIVAGRPGMGKTALATNMAFAAAGARAYERDGGGGTVEVDGHTVAFFSLEMAAEQLALRILGEQSRVSSDRIRRGSINQDDFDLVVQASRRLQSLKLFIDDTPAISVSQLRTRARRLLRTEGRLDLIVVDYLQLMRPPSGASRPEHRVQEVSEITRGLKTVAKELDVPVLALSQLSRAVEQRDDKRPQLADLRESGAIEQDADVVMFVYREEYYLSRREPPAGSEKHDEWKQQMDDALNRADIILAKQRHGPTGTVRLLFEGLYTRFSNLDTRHDGGQPF